MKKSVKEFIRKEHATMCDECQQKIEQRYPELFKENIKVGDWVYWGEDLVAWNGGELTYGFYGGEWRNGLLMSNLYGKTPATATEVEEMLIKEAEKRGFKKGVVFKSSFGTVWKYFSVEKLVYENGSLQLWGDSEDVEEKERYTTGFVTIFDKGKWAEIVEEEKPEVKIEFIDKATGILWNLEKSMLRTRLSLIEKELKQLKKELK